MSNILKDSELLDNALTKKLINMDKKDLVEKLVRYYSHIMELDENYLFVNSDNELRDMVLKEGHDILSQ